ncbi:hypothetical protein [Ruegeria sp. Ofav3-42]|uniref:hypothetical protein n=1 Tax=Ruegeria sp. Ofav3-42 TaxID=2917759 RepID=UPI001EF5D86D|nr:hypothetical protein [Ruegeria sp. Ofav3-42]MCG7520850.1 hypothetical protein [Ruegeria sp. Ofav3-42]
MFVGKAVRHAVSDLLSSADIKVDVGGVATDVAVIKNPPAGSWVDEKKLPALYLFPSGEEISPFSHGKDSRDYQLEVMLQAKGPHDVLDQLDDMQEIVEKTIAESERLGGLVREIRPIRARIHQERGAVVFGARIVTFDVKVSVPRRSPVISS